MSNDIHDAQRLKELQALPLERKIGFTIARITEWYNHYNGQVYVSFSGGKDSTVLLHIARGLFPDIKAVYVDTGLEYPEIKDFVKTFDNVEILRPKMTFKQVLDKYGYPVIGKETARMIATARSVPNGKTAQYFDKTSPRGSKCGGRFCRERWKFLIDAPFKISDNCCREMKKKPMNDFNKKTGLKAISGMMAEESDRRKGNWIKFGCNAFESKYPMSNPLSFWTEQDVLQYIKLMHLPIATVYGDIIRDDKTGKLRCTNCERTGCMFCLFGIHLEKQPNRIQRMYYTHNKIYNYILDNLGFREVMDYIHVPYEPIPKKETLKQGELF